jgi:hypothetical protein
MDKYFDILPFIGSIVPEDIFLTGCKNSPALYLTFAESAKSTFLHYGRTIKG